MKAEDIVIGQVYFYLNKPVIAVRIVTLPHGWKLCRVKPAYGYEFNVMLSEVIKPNSGSK